MERTTGKTIFSENRDNENNDIKSMGQPLVNKPKKGKVTTMFKNNKIKTTMLVVFVCAMLSNCAAAPYDNNNAAPYVPANNASSANASKPETSSDPTAGMTRKERHRYYWLDGIYTVCTVQADVETDKDACVVDVRTDENPYDVTWDYGDSYDAYVDMCDWSMVFDADYYMEQFPMLAYVYHYDEDLLLRHFQTVGVHEGRQGSAKFNVAAYMSKCADDAREFYGDCYAAYYFHWMLVEDDRSMDVSEKNQPKQMTAILTAMQAYEFEQVNALREEQGVDPLVFDSELAALANFRGWIDADEGWEAHDWIDANREQLYDLMDSLNTHDIGENTVKRYKDTITNWYDCYRRSKEHYEAMIDATFSYVGCSNAYLGDWADKYSGVVMVHFDIFACDLSTVLNP